jgi:hypothetical protein
MPLLQAKRFRMASTVSPHYMFVCVSIYIRVYVRNKYKFFARACVCVNTNACGMYTLAHAGA